MSKHKFEFNGEDDEFYVEAGWDHPLQQYFLVVETPNGNPDRPVYSNLFDPALPGPGGAMTVDQVMAKLKELNIVPPKALRAALEHDAIENVAENRIVHYGDDD